MPVLQGKTHPTTYEIVVGGRISQERADWFGDLTLTVRAMGADKHVTVLSGPVADQAALFGILSRIRDLGLRLISVKTIEESFLGGAHGHSQWEEHP